MSPANDRRFVARAGVARLDPDGIEIDPRYRTGGRAIEPGFRQRARFGCTENFAPANPKTESGITKDARAPRLRGESRKGSGRSRIAGPAFAKRNSGDARAGREIGKGAS